MHLTITCNGEYLNAHSAMLGRCSDRLSERGILESLRLAKALKSQHFDFIFCSDFGYRRTTTDLIVEALEDRHFQIIVDNKLREKDAEPCNQLTKENLIKHGNSSPENSQIISRLFIKNESVAPLPSTMEKEEQVIERAKAFIHELMHQYPSNSQVLLVGNALINSFLIATLLETPQYTQYITSPCSLSEFERRNGRWRQLSFNQRQHLYGSMQG